ncbi:UNVERIFIED_CONTAM: hypothetical protein FKN15_032709 [Acipenser sinensis]
MIYKLVQSNTYATKRLLYRSECKFPIERVKCREGSLATSKGFIAGDLCYTEEDGTRVNCSSNSTSMSFDAHSLTVPAVMWLGLLPSDMERLNVPKEVLIPLTKRDLSKLKSLQKRPYMSCQPHWNKEMEIMVKCNMKAELQSLTALAPDYLTRVYLPNKLQFGGWI